MTEQTVLVEVRNRVGHLTLNRPAGLNALNLDMVRQLRQQLDAWLNDDQVRVVVLRANGEKAFCAGGDIRGLYDSYLAGDGMYMTFFREEYALDQLIHDYPKPVVALMDGFVLGGGMGLAQAASHRVITEGVKMGMPETGIGYFPDVGGSYFLSRLDGAIGQYLGITGTHIRAADALYCGLADHCLGSDLVGELDQALDSMQWSDEPASDLDALLHKRASQKIPGSEIKAMRSAIDHHFSQPDMPRIRASLAAEECPAYQDWAERTLAAIDSKSPLAMNVTLELLRQGRELSLPDCFALELHLDAQWFAEGDIMEGVRALIVDKDKNPRWNPPTLDDVSPARVAAFFADFQPGQA
ncbi:enoly-coenzyme A hydratase/isomerase family protein [Pseudomonas saudimassiliensis]|uniref:3-hydroxyisobutyryl-CoA hydrolase n=1 Tax=Pseudomonas saudimassiliensis TaxID=1461581 RepID=A0A078MK00_9PSED|nr:enoyl-CoA hydratase/isomerase family protein [Pseudomonas saudimassiliensis]CEA05752.1 enoly-coenzyme A hydratase/isomerase family protein [Pseudomonas saudimassiliensis]CEF27304.1 enoly-coenzyme A hydratase/isomerase family protein [Pseudomonas saudimassiliensis]